MWELHHGRPCGKLVPALSQAGAEPGHHEEPGSSRLHPLSPRFPACHMQGAQHPIYVIDKLINAHKFILKFTKSVK